MSCPKWEECEKKSCLEQEACMGDYWPNYWKNMASLRPPEPDIVKIFKERKRAEKEEKKKAALIRRAFSKKRSFHMKKCEPRQRGCHLPKVCGLLGECVLTHERTITRPDLIPKLKEATSTRSAVKVLEEIMPSLKRYNDRNSFKPDCLLE